MEKKITKKIKPKAKKKMTKAKKKLRKNGQKIISKKCKKVNVIKPCKLEIK